MEDKFIELNPPDYRRAARILLDDLRADKGCGSQQLSQRCEGDLSSLCGTSIPKEQNMLNTKINGLADMAVNRDWNDDEW